MEHHWNTGTWNTWLTTEQHRNTEQWDTTGKSEHGTPAEWWNKARITEHHHNNGTPLERWKHLGMEQRSTMIEHWQNNETLKQCQ